VTEVLLHYPLKTLYHIISYHNNLSLTHSWNKHGMAPSNNIIVRWRLKTFNKQLPIDLLTGKVTRPEGIKLPVRSFVENKQDTPTGRRTSSSSDTPRCRRLVTSLSPSLSELSSRAAIRGSFIWSREKAATFSTLPARSLAVHWCVIRVYCDSVPYCTVQQPTRCDRPQPTGYSAARNVHVGLQPGRPKAHGAVTVACPDFWPN